MLAAGIAAAVREDEVCKAVYVGRSCVFGENEVRKAVYLGRMRCAKLCI